MLTLQKQNWFQLASVQVGGAICLPLLLVGFELAKLGHPITMAFSIVCGNLLLFGLALIAGCMSMKRPLVTAEHAAHYFGPQAKTFFGLTLSFCMLAWFAIQTQSMGKDLSSFLEPIQKDSIFMDKLVYLSIALLIISGGLLGLNFITWMANLCIPLMLFTIGYAVYSAGSFDIAGILSAPWWSGTGVSLVLASSMAATIDLPTFYRHAKNQKAHLWASAANFLVATPLVQLAGMCLYYGTQSSSMTQSLAFESHPYWKAWSVFFMLLAGWTTNNLNLYSATLSLKSLFKQMSFKKAMIMAGAIAMLLVMTPALEKFSFMLELMGILAISMGSLVFTTFVLECCDLYIKPLCMWIACCAGILAGLHELIWPSAGTGAPVLDACLVSIAVMVILQLGNNLIKSTLIRKEASS